MVFELEKRKVLQEEKDFLSKKQNQEKETLLNLESIQNIYDDKIKLLQEQLFRLKIERNISEKAQLQAIRELEKEFKIENKEKIKNLEEYLIKVSSSNNY